MSNGDPVEEGGQAVRTGFIQAMQTAAMTMNLVRSHGAEGRSVTEFNSRQTAASAEQTRKAAVHDLQLQGYRDRAENAKALHDVELDIKLARRDHDVAEAARRETASANAEKRWDKLNGLQIQGHRADRNRKDAIHTHQLRGYETRAAQAAHLHSLEVELKKLRIQSVRRAQGFTETLTTHSDRDTYNTTTSAAAWAGAQSAADLSDEHQMHAEAYGERYREDTGNDPEDIVEAVLVPENEPADYLMAPTGTIRPQGTIEAATVPEDELADVAESRWPSEVFESTNGLAQELAFGIYGEYLYEFLDDAVGDREAGVETGAVIAEAVEAVVVPGAAGSEIDTQPEQQPIPEPATMPEVEL